MDRFKTLVARSTIGLLEIFTEVLPQKIWVTDPAGNVVFFNRNYLKFLGLEQKEIEGWSWTNILHPEDEEATLDCWKDALKTGELYSIEHRLKGLDGEYHWHLTRAVPGRNEHGEITLWAGSSTDIQSNKAIAEAKDEFISIASHEIKTPLTTVKAFVQILERATKPNKPVSELAAKAALNVGKLERLVSDLLDITKINAGKLQYKDEIFTINEMLKETVDSMKATSSTHEIVIENLQNATVRGDSFRIQQVLVNFISNAIKYSPAADKVIVCSKVEQGEVIISVQDFGIGISEANISKLFARFYRADSSNHTIQGLGLGLYISSEILKRHRATFWVKSQLGKGSTFYFSLPITQSE